MLYKGYQNLKQKRVDEKRCKDALRRSQDQSADGHAFSFYKHSTEQTYHSECCPTRAHDFYIENEFQGLSISEPPTLRTPPRRESQDSCDSLWTPESQSSEEDSSSCQERQVRFNPYAEVIPRHILRPYRRERRAAEAAAEGKAEAQT